MDKKIEDLKIEEIIEFCKKKFGLKTMLDQIDDYDILDTLDNNEILLYLDDTYALATHDDNIREQAYHEGYKECFNEYYNDKKDFAKSISEYSSDDLHRFMCSVMNVGYADQSILDIAFKDMIERLNKNSFNIRYEHR